VSCGPVHEAPSAADGVPPALRHAALAWIAADPDPETRAALAALLERGDVDALEACFAGPVSFGTAGARGPLGPGPARLNRLVVRRLTDALARVLHERGDAALGVVVGYDARHGSAAFAEDTARVLAGAGIPTWIASAALPTPVTAFTVRRLGAAAGVMITASHNPAADNGYKVYDADGAQLAPPADAQLGELAARSLLCRDDGLAGPDDPLLHRVQVADLLEPYVRSALSLFPPDPAPELRVVYSPLHGVGGVVVPALLERAGLAAPIPVPSQERPDPDFPTAPFPNPEEPSAMEPALRAARAAAADLVLVNDPDADRLGVAAPTRRSGDLRVLTGDEVGILLASHVLSETTGPDRLVATTVVSSSRLAALARAEGVEYAETLTGFKWIARAGDRRPGTRLVFGYEEALGYLVNPAVRDKDGIVAGLAVARLVARARRDGRSVDDLLDALDERLGVHATRQLSLRVSRAGEADAAAIFERFRALPPRRLAGLDVLAVEDFSAGGVRSRRAPDQDPLPPHPLVVLTLGATGGTGLARTPAAAGPAGTSARVALRPSGTEAKLKCYLEVACAPVPAAEAPTARAAAQWLVDALREDLTSRLGALRSAP
jgi:phosphomannomutase